MSRLKALILCSTLVAASMAEGTEIAADSPAAIDAGAVGGPFILMDHNGKSVTDEDYRGSFLLVVFGYTHCPDVCPTTLMNVASAMNILGPEAKSIRPLFISVDPARDTPERLKEYVELFGPSFVRLTGPEAFIQNVADKYRIKFSRTRSGESPSGRSLLRNSTSITRHLRTRPCLCAGERTSAGVERWWRRKIPVSA